MTIERPKRPEGCPVVSGETSCDRIRDSFCYISRVRIIVNPAAAGGRLGREWPTVQRRLRGLGIDAEYTLTERPWQAVELAERAVWDGAEVVVAAGGDGTVFEAAMGLYRAGGGRLAVLPLGTGNDIARTFGVPLKLEDAAHTVLDGAVREVDLIRIGDYVVPNAIGVGLLGDISARAARIKWIRGFIVYLVTAVVSLIRFPTPRVRMTTPDGTVYDGTMTIIAVKAPRVTGWGERRARSQTTTAKIASR